MSGVGNLRQGQGSVDEEDNELANVCGPRFKDLRGSCRVARTMTRCKRSMDSKHTSSCSGTAKSHSPPRILPPCELLGGVNVPTVCDVEYAAIPSGLPRSSLNVYPPGGRFQVVLSKDSFA